ncbi:MAG: hypothetical protein R3F43_20995 [bacterium]
MGARDRAGVKGARLHRMYTGRHTDWIGLGPRAVVGSAHAPGTRRSGRSGRPATALRLVTAPGRLLAGDAGLTLEGDAWVGPLLRAARKHTKPWRVGLDVAAFDLLVLADDGEAARFPLAGEHLGGGRHGAGGDPAGPRRRGSRPGGGGRPGPHPSARCGGARPAAGLAGRRSGGRPGERRGG